MVDAFRGHPAGGHDGIAACCRGSSIDCGHAAGPAIDDKNPCWCAIANARALLCRVWERVTSALARICAHAEAFWAQKPMSSMASAGLLQGVPIKMFQYEICPFCNKIKTVLDFCKVCAPDRTRVRRHLAVRHSSATDMLSLC